jgi:hypothetical protein
MASKLTPFCYNHYGMKNQRPLIRRTLSQERFEVLIKKQLNGTASFRDLIELDEIVNRDPTIRENILEEMHEIKHPPQDNDPRDIINNIPQAKPQTLIDRIKEFFSRLFFSPPPAELTTCN